MISRLELQQGTTTTHRLEEPRIGMISRLEFQQVTTATHLLESQGQADQQARISASHHSHSLPGEPRTVMISRLKAQ